MAFFVFNNNPQEITVWQEYASQTTAPTPTQWDAIDLAHPNATWKYTLAGQTVVYALTTDSAQILRAASNSGELFTIGARVLDPTHDYTLAIERTNGEPSRGTARSYLTGIRSIANIGFTYPRNVLLGIQGIASERYSGNLQVTPLVEGAYVQVFDGSVWSTWFTCNPAWIAYDVLTVPVYDNQLNIVRYDGIPPANINTADFLAWADLCDELVDDGDGGTEKRFLFSGIFDTSSNIWDAANRIAKYFRAFLYFNGVEVRCAISQQVSAPVMIFSEGNIISGSFEQFYMPWEDRVTEIEVSYIDRTANYERTQVAVIDGGLTQSKNKLSITAFGTTTASQAWRIGKYLLANNKYTHKSIKFSADIDAIDCMVGDVIEFQHSTPNWGLGGRVLSAVSDHVVFEGILDDQVFLELGFSQGVIDGWRANESGYSTMSSLGDVSFEHRATDNVLTSYPVTSGGVNVDGNTVLYPTNVWVTQPVADDVYVINCGTTTSAKWFTVGSIVQSDDLTMDIHAVEYNELIFTESDSAATLDDLVYESQTTFPPVTNITADTILYIDQNNLPKKDINLTFVKPTSASYRSVYIYYQTGTSATSFSNQLIFAGNCLASSYRLTDVPMSPWFRIIFSTINVDGDQQQLNLSPSIVHESTLSWELEIPIMETGVTNLVVENSTGDNLTFESPDCIIAWDAPTGNWELTNWLEHYRINFYAQGTSTVIYSETTLDTRVVFSLEENRSAGLVRTFDVGVAAVDKQLNIGFETKITPINPQAGQVTNVSAESTFGTMTVIWDRVSDPALQGYEVHVGNTSSYAIDFTPSAATLLTTAAPDQLSAVAYLPEDSYYVRIGAWDVFGKVGMVYSVGELINISYTADMVNFPEEMSNLYKIPVQNGDSWSISNPNLSWNSHSLWYLGIEYTITANAGTADKYIYWTGPPSLSYSTTNDLATFQAIDNGADEWQIAQNFATAFELAWNAQANMAIGNAKIGVAAIENVNIGNEIKSDTWSYVEGVSAAGWQITKDGKIRGTELQILNTNGTVLLGVGDDLDFANVGGTTKPADNADVTATSNFVTVTYPADKTAIEGLIDGKIDTWFTANVDPSATWLGDDAEHEGDMWWNSTTNELKRYTGTAWSAALTDQVAIDAYSNAATAQTTADGKMTVFVTEPAGPYYIGDLWDRGSSLGIWRCNTDRLSGYLLAEWQVASDITANSTFVQTTYPADYSTLEGLIDGKIDTWFTDTDPSGTWEGTDASHEGDMWWKITLKTLHRYSGTAWSSAMTDQTAIDAYADAATAQDTADEKRRVFTTTPTAPYDIGDLWDRGSTIGLWRCITARVSGYLLAEWQGVADITENHVVGTNLVLNGDFEFGERWVHCTDNLAGWEYLGHFTPDVRYAAIWETTTGHEPPWGGIGTPVYYAHSATGDTTHLTLIRTVVPIHIDATKNYCLAGWFKGNSTHTYFRMECYNSVGTAVGYPSVLNNATLPSTWTQVSTTVGPDGAVTWPVGTVKANVEVYATYYEDSVYCFFSRISLNEGLYPAPWGGLITDPEADSTETALSATTSITQGGLRITDTSTTHNDYVEITPSNIQFYINDAYYKSPRRILVGTQTSNTAVTFSPAFVTMPKVICMPQEVKTFESSESTSDHAIQVAAESVSTSGFLPVARVLLQTGLDITYTHADTDERITTNTTIESLYITISECHYITAAYTVEVGGDGYLEYRRDRHAFRVTMEYKIGSGGSYVTFLDDVDVYTVNGTGHSPFVRYVTGITSGASNVYVKITTNGPGAKVDYILDDADYIAYYCRYTKTRELAESDLIEEGEVSWLAIEGG